MTAGVSLTLLNPQLNASVLPTSLPLLTSPTSIINHHQNFLESSVLPEVPSISLAGRAIHLRCFCYRGVDVPITDKQYPPVQPFLLVCGNGNYSCSRVIIARFHPVHFLDQTISKTIKMYTESIT